MTDRDLLLSFLYEVPDVIDHSTFSAEEMAYSLTVFPMVGREEQISPKVYFDKQGAFDHIEMYLDEDWLHWKPLDPDESFNEAVAEIVADCKGVYRLYDLDGLQDDFLPIAQKDTVTSLKAPAFIRAINIFIDAIAYHYDGEPNRLPIPEE